MKVIESTIRISTGDMDYISFGEGKKPFVLIAGMGTTGLAGLAAPVSQAYSVFAEDYTTVLFDRITVLPSDYTVRDMARDIAESMRLLGISNADICGASQGGMIAQYLAIDYPELCHSVVMAASCCRMDAAGYETMTKWKRLSDNGEGRALYRDFFERVYLHPDYELLAAIEDTATEAQLRRFSILAQACLDFDSTAELEKIHCPAMVFGGDNELALGKGCCDELAERLHCPLKIYPGYAHAMYDEAPDFKKDLIEFYNSLS